MPVCGLIFSVLLPLVVSCAPSLESDPADPVERLGDYMDTLGRHGFTGAVLVRRDGHVLLSRGYGTVAGDRDRGTAITDSTLFYAASVSKQFTGLAVRTAIEEGILDGESSLAELLPEIDPVKGAITVDQMLAHSSGLPEYSAGWREAYGAAEARERAMTAELRFPPGTEYAYSNTGYTLLALLVEQTSGLPFPRYLQTRVFEPAGMVDSYLLGEARPSHLVGAHGLVDGEAIWAPEDWRGPGWSHYGAGGVVTTLRDMKAWVGYLDECSQRPDSPCRAALAPLIETRGGYYASGVRLAETDYGGSVVYHFGSEANGHSAAFMWFPDAELTVVVLSNRLEEDRAYANRTAVALARKTLEPDYEELPFYAE